MADTHSNPTGLRSFSRVFCKEGAWPRKVVVASQRKMAVSCVSHHVQIRCPKLKLPAPVGDGGERGTDQEGTIRQTLIQHTHTHTHTTKYCPAHCLGAVTSDLFVDKEMMVCIVFPRP